jgi:hypothetical protein
MVERLSGLVEKLSLHQAFAHGAAQAHGPTLRREVVFQKLKLE